MIKKESISFVRRLIKIVFALLFCLIFSPTCAFADITFDTSTSTSFGYGSTNTTLSTTVGASSNRLLLVAIEQEQNTDNVTGVTYNGVAMTRIGAAIGSGEGAYIYGLLSPDSGTHDVVVSYSASTTRYVFAASYAGVDQTALPSTVTTNSAVSVGSLVLSLTTPVDNSWVAGIVGEDYANGISVGSDTIRTELDPSSRAWFDTNGAIATSSNHTMTASVSGSGNWAGVMVAMKPYNHITFDAASSINDGTGAGTTTLSLTVASSSNRLLLVGIGIDQVGTDPVVGVTYDGVAMTQVAKEIGNNETAYIYGLLAPSIGTHNILVTYSSSVARYVMASSYSGASQTSLPSVIAKSSGNGISNLSLSFTLSFDNSWVAGVVSQDSSQITITSNHTSRTSPNLGRTFFDSNGGTSTIGNNTANFTSASAGNWAGVMVAIKSLDSVAVSLNSTTTFDSASSVDEGTGAGTTTLSLTVASTSNRLLLVGIGIDTAGADPVTGVTYNGVAMTQIGKVIGTNETAYLYGLIAPSIGMHDVLVSYNSSVSRNVLASAYYGVDQQTLPNTIATSSLNSTTSLSMSLATPVNSSWVAGVISEDSNPVSITSGHISRTSPNIARLFFDTNGAIVTAGNNTATFTSTSAGNWAGVMAAIKPYNPITFDTSTSTSFGYGSTNTTLSTTVGTSSNRLLLVAVEQEQNTDNVTGVTYNGVAMTRIGAAIGSGEGAYIYGLLAPDSGTHDVAVSYSAGTTRYVFAASYAGVDQTSLPSTVVTNSAVSAGSLALSLTTPVDNSWVAGIVGEDYANGISVGSDTIRTELDPSSRAWFDTNGAIASAGNHTMTASVSGNGNWAGVMVVIKPY